MIMNNDPYPVRRCTNCGTLNNAFVNPKRCYKCGEKWVFPA